MLPVATAAAREVAERLPEGDEASKVLCHGDLWPAHVRFDGDSFVGFTDSESMVFASPALDLAQLVSHFGGWRMREEILQTYEALAPLEENHWASLAAETAADLAR